MADLDFAIISDSARVADDMMFVLAGGWDTIQASNVPADVHLALALRLLFNQSECDRPHRLEVFVRGADGQELARMDGTTTPNRPEGVPIHWKANSMLAVRFPVRFPDYGEYVIDILLNDSSVKELPLRVVRAPQGQ